MHRIMTWRSAMSGSHGLYLALDILLANVFCRTACCKQGRDKRVDKCEDIWVCRELRDVSCGHQF